MDTKKQQCALIWITRQGLYLYVQNELYQYAFSPDVVQYLDVVNESQFQMQLESFFLQHIHTPLHIYVIIGPDALTEKEFPLSYHFEDVQAFFDLVPYEQILSKLWKGDGLYKAYAFNADIYYRLQSAVQKTGSTIDSVIPYFITGQTTFTPQTIPLILKKADAFIHENMIVSDSSTNALFEQVSPETRPKEQKSILPILLPVLFFLILVFIAVVILNRQPEKKSINANIAPPIPRNTSPSPVATQSAKLKNAVSIKISYPTAASESAGRLRDRFVMTGYSNITLNESPLLNAQTTLVLIKATVSPALREELSNIIIKISPSPIIQDSDTISNDVDISLKSP